MSETFDPTFVSDIALHELQDWIPDLPVVDYTDMQKSGISAMVATCLDRATPEAARRALKDLTGVIHCDLSLNQASWGGPVDWAARGLHPRAHSKMPQPKWHQRSDIYTRQERLVIFTKCEHSTDPDWFTPSLMHSLNECLQIVDLPPIVDGVACTAVGVLTQVCHGHTCTCSCGTQAEFSELPTGKHPRCQGHPGSTRVLPVPALWSCKS